jgi:hypothetical protein
MNMPLLRKPIRKAVNRRKLLFWLIMLAIGAGITSYLFYIDDWEEKHKPGYKSTDSIELLIAVFTFYTLLITGVLGGVFYAILRHWLNKSPGKKSST